MIIESKSIVITDVPGVDSIKIQTDGTLSTIEVDWSVGTTAGVFSPAKLKELIDALTAAHSMATLTAAHSMATLVTGSADEEYAFWHDIPENVSKVRDNIGMTWDKSGLPTWAHRFNLVVDPDQYGPFVKAE